MKPQNLFNLPERDDNDYEPSWLGWVNAILSMLRTPNTQIPQI